MKSLSILERIDNLHSYEVDGVGFLEESIKFLVHVDCIRSYKYVSENSFENSPWNDDSSENGFSDM